MVWVTEFSSPYKDTQTTCQMATQFSNTVSSVRPLPVHHSNDSIETHHLRLTSSSPPRKK